MKGKALKGLARSLRRNSTEAEGRLWRYLRSRQFQDVKFRRQQPLGSYIVDFCSLEGKVVIELDGGQHLEQEDEDVRRTRFLEREGFCVIRVWNDEIFTNMEGVMETIQSALRDHPHPSPLPSRERENDVGMKTYSPLPHGARESKRENLSLGKGRTQISPLPLGEG